MMMTGNLVNALLLEGILIEVMIEIKVEIRVEIRVDLMTGKRLRKLNLRLPFLLLIFLLKLMMRN